MKTNDWKLGEFDETGGYDCMTPAVRLTFKFPNGTVGEIRIDAKDFGHTGFNDLENKNTVLNNEQAERTIREVGKQIVEAMNQGGIVSLYNAAVERQLPRISTIPYNSHEICKHFANEVRNDLLKTTRDSWLMVAPLISTAHITEDTNNWADELSLLDRNNYMIIPMLYGFMVYVGEDESESKNFPEDLQAVLAWARTRGFQWVRLDRDADTVEELNTYDW